MLIPKSDKSQGIFIHLQTYLLLRNPELFVITSRLAMAASVLFYLIGSHDRLSEWMLRELSLVDDVCRIYTRQFLESWHLYVEATTRQDFRQCLVPESPHLPLYTKCPGLTKFILALYTATKGLTGAEPHVFGLQELRDRHHATVVEFLARTRMAVSNCLEYDAQREADQFLWNAWSSPLDQDAADPQSTVTVGGAIMAASLTVREAKHRFSTMVEMGLGFSEMISNSTKSARISTKGLEAARHYQLSIARIDSTFKNLACICGLGDEVPFALSQPELIRALQLANAHPSAYERSTLPPIDRQVSQADDLSALAKSMAEKLFVQHVRSSTEAVAGTGYTARHRTQHAGLARIIPQQHMERFKQLHGLDIARDWAVNSGGLSNNACCSPDCPYYLDLLNANPASVSTTICPELNQHLLMGTAEQPIPGFHKAVSRFRDSTPISVMGKVENGLCINDPPPTASQRRYLKSISALKDTAATQFLERELAKSVDEKKSKLIACAKAKCDELNSTDSDLLLTDIAALQNEFAAPSWPYEDFEQTFLAKYKKYPRLTGGAVTQE
jgi:hypothetical protein